MGIVAELREIWYNSGSIGPNWMILVPFDSSRRDESNGTKIVQFGSRDLKLFTIVCCTKLEGYCGG